MGHPECSWVGHPPFRLADKEKDVFGHEDVAMHLETVPFSQRFEPTLEAFVSGFGVQVWEPPITAEGDEVEVALVLVSAEADGHGVIVCRRWAGADRTFVR